MKIEKGIRYFYINEYGYVMNKNWNDEIYDIKRAEIGNCFETVVQANFEIERLKVMTEMKKYEGEGNERYILIYDCKDDIICPIKPAEKTALAGGIYFSTWKCALACIANIGYKRLKKYYFRIKETT